MAKKSKADLEGQPVDENARLETGAEDRAKATKWFARARELGEKRQFDYAIEYYVNGLEFWPDAVEEACKPLHGCAVARRQTGGKKTGLKDTMTRSMNDKNARKAFLNALWLFGHEPENVSYAEGVFKAANRLRADDAALWAGTVCLRAFESAIKANAKQLNQFANVAEELGDRAAARKETAFGIEAYQLGISALNHWQRHSPKDRAVEDAIRNLSTKLTILKGQYKDGESFRDSIADADEQDDLRDKQRSVQSEERLVVLVAKAKQVYEENPDDARNVRALVELYCKLEQEESEMQAIVVLVNEYKRMQDYRWKQLADDIRIKQLTRKGRQLAKSGDKQAYKEHQVSQLRFELTVFKERVERYPTDNRLKFELGVRNFRAGRFDDAIPLLQVARSDPKNRAACALYLGRCFYRKGYHSQAIETLNQAISEYEYQDDDTAKSMLYWLGCAQEGANQQDKAKQTYGKLLQLDYNYRDVRRRLDGLNA